jgi:hypothetical protein
MGIQLWQSRVTITDTESPELAAKPELVQELIQEPTPKFEVKAAAKSDQVQNQPVTQPPLLVAQLERAIDYCHQQAKQPVKLSWVVDHNLSQIERADNQLLLPDLTKVFTTPTLKKQLWHHIHHRTEN